MVIELLFSCFLVECDFHGITFSIYIYIYIKVLLILLYYLYEYSVCVYIYIYIYTYNHNLWDLNVSNDVLMVVQAYSDN